MKKSADTNNKNTVATVNEKPMTTMDQVNEFAYYKGLLLLFLAEAHPRFITQHNFTLEQWENFLTERKNAAEIEEEKRTMEGECEFMAEKYAKIILFSGLHLSLHLIVDKILDEDYHIIKTTLSLETIEAMEDYCKPTLDQYDLGDNYESDPLYPELIQKLKNQIHQFLMKNV